MPEYQGFYSLAQVARLAGVPRRTLSDWRWRGIVVPSVELKDASGKVVAEGYSYADLTIIRLLRALRRGLDFDAAAVALRHLYERLGPPSKGWASAHVYFVGKRIFAEKPDEWGVTDATRFGQRLETRLFGELFEELKDLEEGASILVPKEFRNHVEINPMIRGGEPVLRGTRIPTSLLLALVDQGHSIRQIANAYSPISERSIRAAVEYERFLDLQAA